MSVVIGILTKWIRSIAGSRAVIQIVVWKRFKSRLRNIKMHCLQRTKLRGIWMESWPRASWSQEVDDSGNTSSLKFYSCNEDMFTWNTTSIPRQKPSPCSIQKLKLFGHKLDSDTCINLIFYYITFSCEYKHANKYHSLFYCYYSQTCFEYNTLHHRSVMLKIFYHVTALEHETEYWFVSRLWPKKC